MVVMPAKVQKDVCNQEDIGQQKYTNFVEERINTNEVSILARMKVQQKTWKSARKLKVDTERAIETFVCQLYEPGSTVVDVGDLRWKLFTKKQLEAQKLPPTRGALHEAIARAHYQAMMWRQDNITHPQLPPATTYGWKEDGNRLVPVPTKDPPAPATVIHLIKCGCKKTSCTSHWSCRSQGFNCSEICLCGADE